MGQFSYACKTCGGHEQFDWITPCVVELALTTGKTIHVEGVWWQFVLKFRLAEWKAAGRAVMVTSPGTQTITDSVLEVIELTREELTERAEDKIRLRMLGRPRGR